MNLLGTICLDCDRTCSQSNRCHNKPQSWPFRLASDQISTCWLAKSMVQHKTKQHKTHNNQYEMPPPYPPAALPSPSMVRPVAPPKHGAEVTKVPKQGVRCWVCAQRSWLPCSLHHTETPWESERWEGSWPHAKNLIETHNNRKSMIAVGGMLERGHAGLKSVGRCCPIIWVKTGTKKNIIKWITPRPKVAADWWGYSQQPTRNRWAWRRWYRRGGLTGGDCLGDVIPSFWGQ